MKLVPSGPVVCYYFDDDDNSNFTHLKSLLLNVLLCTFPKGFVKNMLLCVALSTNWTGWSSTFLIDPAILAEIWKKLELHDHEEEWIQKGGEPRHFLWAALLLKQYTNDSDIANKCGCHEDTFQKWAWKMVDLIAGLESEVVSFG